LKAYLDSSAWVKRYLTEEGSPEVDTVFERAISGRVKLISSFWNIGECIGVFDRRRKRGELKDGEFGEVLQNFFSETIDLAERGSFELVPVSAGLLLECWKIIVEEHVYQADALQLRVSLAEGCDVFLTGDEELAQIARRHEINAVSVEKSDEREKLRELFKST